MESLFKENAKSIRVYVATEIENDPYEHTVDTANLTPYVIKAMITDLTTAQVAYKMPGIISEKSKELMIEKKYRTLIESCNKIVIENEDFYGWRDSAGKNIQIREEGEFLRLYIYIRND